MPLFTNKFSAKKITRRKSSSLSSLHGDLDPDEAKTEFGLNYSQPRLKLGNQESTFQRGQWFSESDGSRSVYKEQLKLQKENQHLLEENNLLKLKIEILLDMLAETTSQLHLEEEEIEQMRRLLSGKPQ